MGGLGSGGPETRKSRYRGVLDGLFASPPFLRIKRTIDACDLEDATRMYMYFMQRIGQQLAGDYQARYSAWRAGKGKNPLEIGK